MLPFLIVVVFSYLIGSIPFGYILVRTFCGQDVRQSGSGNIGATNVARSSPVLGLFTLLLDAGKGSAAVAVAILLSRSYSLGGPAPESDTAIRAALAAFLAVLGHMLPVWLLREYHDEPFVLALVSASSLLIVLQHRENIRRLMQGTEPHLQRKRG